MVVDILADPFEMTPEELSYYDDWINRRMFLLSPMAALVGKFMATFEAFPPHAKAHLVSRQMISGQERIVERLIISLLTNGNPLIERLLWPAKTRVIRAMVGAIDSEFSRIQLTPDLPPSDVTAKQKPASLLVSIPLAKVRTSSPNLFLYATYGIMYPKE